MTDDQPPVVNGNPVVEASGLIAAVAALISGSTATIMARLDAMERSETTRWRLHDEELERNRAAITAKFEKVENELAAEIVRVEKALEAHLVLANIHFAREHDDDLVMQGRVRPLKSGIAWVGANYKNALIALFAVLGFLLGFAAIVADLASRYLGGST